MCYQQHRLLSGNSPEAVAGSKFPRLEAVDGQANGVLASASSTSSKVVGGKVGRYRGARSSSSSLSTASTSPSGAGKNNPGMTGWLHHFLDSKARKAPGDIARCWSR